MKGTWERLPPMDGQLMGPHLIQGLQPLAVAKFLVGLCSESIPPPSPPSPNKTQYVRLISIANSNYAEKARWALELCQADEASPYYYAEDIHPPAFHCFFSLAETQNEQSRTPIVVFHRATDKASSQATQPPVLDSDAIVRTFCPHLYPPAVAEAISVLEQDLGHRLGATIRSLYFCGAFHRNDTLYYPGIVRLCTAHVTPIERLLFANMLDKGVDRGIIDCLQLTREANEEAEKVLKQTFAELSEHVIQHKLLDQPDSYWMDSPTQRYGFTAADLCIATYVASFCGDVPALDGVASNNVRDADLPEELRQLRTEMRATPVAAFARRIYEQHRPVGPDNRVVIRKMRKAKNPFYNWKVAAISVGITAAGIALWRKRR